MYWIPAGVISGRISSLACIPPPPWCTCQSCQIANDARATFRALVRHNRTQTRKHHSWDSSVPTHNLYTRCTSQG
ncbi:hypothetical protein C8Q73DRAFT_690456 [Cubamyces lactineus]|nr:hypothetical protein C8Q73DRAFT_690456 [Cubamyces lactineus]